VAGIEARGFLLAAAVAYATGVGVVPIRKQGKLPRATHTASYDLEYGSATIEVHADAFAAGSAGAVVDDVLATGGTRRPTLSLIERAAAPGGRVRGAAGARVPRRPAAAGGARRARAAAGHRRLVRDPRNEDREGGSSDERDGVLQSPPGAAGRSGRRPGRLSFHPVGWSFRAREPFEREVPRARLAG
jgi:hypothetical protein